jgi:hypothetical protein
MKVEIEIYRGWSISFDTEKETFYCHSEQWDKDENKKSFASTRKWIDDFIKENEVFKPIWVEIKPDAYNIDKRIKLIGIRKDGRFIYENEKGDKKQLSDYNEKDYILYNPENDKYREEANQVSVELEELRLKRNAILKKVVGIELTEYKKQILGQNVQS